MKLRRLLALAALLASTSFASAEMVYHRGNPGDPATLDPAKTSTVPESDILMDMLEGLVTYDAKASLVPGAAASWTISPDGLVYTFKLDPNGKWSNGDKVKATDFAFSLRRMMDPATGSGYANVLYPIKNGEKVNKGSLKPDELGVKALDDATLEITLEAATPYFLGLLAHQSTFPVNQAAVEKFGKDFVKPGNLVSNGAFMLKDFTPNDKLVLVKNPHFHDAANVKIDTEIFYPLEDRGAALRRFQAGEILAYNDVPTDQIKFIRANLKDEFRVSPYLGTYYFVFNLRKKPFDDIRIRHAMSMVVDREFLAEQIWGGTMLPGYSFVPPGIGNYGTPAMLPYKDQSPIDREEKAVALMKEAGYGPGKPLKLDIHFNTSENHKNTSIALADMWKPLGIEVTFTNTDIKTHYGLLRDKGDFDVARAGWIGDYSDPQNFLFLGQSDNKGLNYATYANADFDALMKKAAATTDIAERGKILLEADKIFMRDEPFLTLLTYESKNLVSKKISGWEPNTLDRHLARYLSVAP